MKLNTKLASAILGTLVLANSAHAAIEDGSGLIGAENVGGSELFFAATDGAGTTYVRDLGVAFSDMASLSTGPLSYSADSDLLSIIGSSTFSWTVLATDANASGTGFAPENYGNRFMATSTSGNSVLNGSTNQQINTVNQGAAGIDSFADANNFIMGGTAVDNTTAVTVGPGSSAYDNLITPTGGISGSSGLTGMLGDTLSFLLYSTTGTVGGFGAFTFYTVDGVASELLGDWTLDSAGNLAFSAVPVPAAVWLFGSALLGLVGVSRRKQQIAVA